MATRITSDFVCRRFRAAGQSTILSWHPDERSQAWVTLLCITAVCYRKDCGSIALLYLTRFRLPTPFALFGAAPSALDKSGGKLKATGLYRHSSTAIKRQGDAPPCLINSGRISIFTRGLVILSQSTRHLQPAMDFLINAP